MYARSEPPYMHAWTRSSLLHEVRCNYLSARPRSQSKIAIVKTGSRVSDLINVVLLEFKSYKTQCITLRSFCVIVKNGNVHKVPTSAPVPD